MVDHFAFIRIQCHPRFSIEFSPGCGFCRSGEAVGIYFHCDYIKQNVDSCSPRFYYFNILYVTALHQEM